MATAADIMTTEVLSIPETATVRDALRALDELDVRHLPVLDAKREVVGMISDRDLSERNRSPEELAQAVSEVMSADVIVVTPATDVTEIIDLMTENRIGAVPVVDNDSQLAGIVSYVDVLRAAGKVLSEEPTISS